MVNPNLPIKKIRWMWEIEIEPWWQSCSYVQHALIKGVKESYISHMYWPLLDRYYKFRDTYIIHDAKPAHKTICVLFFYLMVVYQVNANLSPCVTNHQPKSISAYLSVMQQLSKSKIRTVIEYFRYTQKNISSTNINHSNDNFKRRSSPYYIDMKISEIYTSPHIQN